jgi:hypothetical protein
LNLEKKMNDSVWTIKGGTFSDKSARKEFELTQDEIFEAINEGKLQYRHNHIHGNPYLRLVRSEVEKLVCEKYGTDYLEKKKDTQELKLINKELRRLKSEMKSFEQRKTELLSKISEYKNQ